MQFLKHAGHAPSGATRITAFSGSRRRARGSGREKRKRRERWASGVRLGKDLAGDSHCRRARFCLHGRQHRHRGQFHAAGDGRLGARGRHHHFDRISREGRTAALGQWRSTGHHRRHGDGQDQHDRPEATRQCPGKSAQHHDDIGAGIPAGKVTGARTARCRHPGHCCRSKCGRPTSRPRTPSDGSDPAPAARYCR